MDGKEKLEMMSSLGADRVIDYRIEDFTQNGQCYDFILDFAGYHSVFDYRRAPLRKAAEAFRYFGEGHARGKIVVTMEE